MITHVSQSHCKCRTTIHKSYIIISDQSWCLSWCQSPAILSQYEWWNTFHSPTVSDHSRITVTLWVTHHDLQIILIIWVIYKFVSHWFMMFILWLVQLSLSKVSDNDRWPACHSWMTTHQKLSVILHSPNMTENQRMWMTMGASSLTRSVHSHLHHRLQILRHCL